MIKIGKQNAITGSTIGDHFHGVYYIITLKNDKKVKIYYIGHQLEEVLESYNIPYEIKRKC